METEAQNFSAPPCLNTITRSCWHSLPLSLLVSVKALPTTTLYLTFYDSLGELSYFTAPNTQ